MPEKTCKRCGHDLKESLRMEKLYEGARGDVVIVAYCSHCDSAKGFNTSDAAGVEDNLARAAQALAKEAEGYLTDREMDLMRLAAQVTVELNNPPAGKTGWGVRAATKAVATEHPQYAPELWQAYFRTILNAITDGRS